MDNAGKLLRSYFGFLFGLIIWGWISRGGWDKIPFPQYFAIAAIAALINVYVLPRFKKDRSD